MAHHFVKWEIDIFDANTAQEAAQKALEIMRDPESVATIFDVHNLDTGRKTRVDVLEDEE